MRARFLVLNVMLVAVLAAAWRAGLFDGFPVLGWQESAMLCALGTYGLFGLAAAFAGRWNIANHIANGAPIMALPMTGLGLILAAQGVHDLTPAALAGTFRAMVTALSPNVAAVVILYWLRELEAWCGEKG